VVLAVAIGVVAVYALRNVVASKDHVITVDAQLLQDAESMRSALERKGGAIRGFLLTRDDHLLDAMRDARGELTATLDRLRKLAPAEAAHSLDTITRLEAEHQQETDRVIALRRSDATVEAAAKEFEEKIVPKRDLLDAAIREFIATEKQQLETSRIASTEAAASATNLVIGIGIGTVMLGILLAWILARTLSRQIAGAVGQVQSSSAELQAAANQQATGSKEQATAMNEITTTISELLATSRQIAESAQRVAQIAGQTATAAKAGDGTVDKAHGSITAIRQQVDLVVTHMLELGKKSQQIGAVLDIVSELAEQTNILAINATIEAAGAGDAGKRFAVVADEIRKLADRVAVSTKEVRALIDDVRSAVNTTVMATETGSKAVDAGSKQFGDVASSFQQIAGLVTTTTEASREIELSTKQQTTAVEQVNLAIANVAQATKETEASSGQTLATASQLAGLSKELLWLVQPKAD
jgi:methyl-accepting chemotaxis protein